MIAILGGGISGLTIAYELKKQNKEFILLEADSQVGGKIKSIQEKGFTFELGPNTVIINNNEIKVLLDELNLTEEIIQPDEEAVKKRFVLFNGKMEALPTGPKAIFTSKLIGLKSILKVLGEPLIKAKTDKEESLADFTRRRLGNQIYENFIYPFVTGIYAGNPERMTMDYTLKILKEAEEKHGSILKGMIKIMKQKKLDNESAQLPQQKIFTFKEGLQRLPIKLAEQFQDSIECKATVVKIDKKEKTYSIQYDSDGIQKTIEVNQIISTLPAVHLSKLISWASLLTKSIKQIHYVPAFISHFVFDKKVIKNPEKAFGLLGREHEKSSFLGILFNSKFFPHSAPKGKELITVISGGYKQSHFLDLNQEDISSSIKTDLKNIFTTTSEPEFEHFHIWKEGIPQYELGHKNIVSAIEKFERENNSFHILGNFRDGISVSDCISNGVKFVNQIK